MSRRHLTGKQNAFLEFLQAHVHQHRIWPTYREIVDHFEYRSPNSVTQNLQALSRKGFLERDRNGYRLVDHSGRDGTIAVRGTLRAGGIAPDETTERLSLAALFSDLAGLHALRLDVGVGLSDLDEAQYVLVEEGAVAEGDTAVVLDRDTVRLARVGADGDLDASAGATVVGRYAGHAGAYGIVRHGPPAPALPADGLARTGAMPDGLVVLMAAEAQADAASGLSAPAAEALAHAQPSAEA